MDKDDLLATLTINEFRYRFLISLSKRQGESFTKNELIEIFDARTPLRAVERLEKIGALVGGVELRRDHAPDGKPQYAKREHPRTCWLVVENHPLWQLVTALGGAIDRITDEGSESELSL